MKHTLLSIFLLWSALGLVAQATGPMDYGLKPFVIKDKKLGVIRFYVDTTGIGQKAPLFVDVNGSGGLPLCLFVQGKDFATVANTFAVNHLQETRDKYHYVILDKPGTPFCDTVTLQQDLEHLELHRAAENYVFSEEYTKKLSLEWRVEATKKVISYLVRHGFWDKSKILAFGFSEGGQVVSTLAVEDRRVTHIAVVAGSGLNQFYDDIVGWRIKAAKGEVTQQQAQDSIVACLGRIADVYRHPLATDRSLGGHSYKRGASFCAVSPFEQLRKLNIPIYLVAGTDDYSSPIFGLDYVLLDFMRLGKTNLTYEVCVGCNHHMVSEAQGQTVVHDYLKKVLAWAERH